MAPEKVTISLSPFLTWLATRNTLWSAAADSVSRTWGNQTTFTASSNAMNAAITMHPAAYAEATNGGVTVDLGREVHAALGPLPRYSLVFGPDGNLACSQRTFHLIPLQNLFPTLFERSATGIEDLLLPIRDSQSFDVRPQVIP
jgi:hypothetical protein